MFMLPREDSAAAIAEPDVVSIFKKLDSLGKRGLISDILEPEWGICREAMLQQ